VLVTDPAGEAVVGAVEERASAAGRTLARAVGYDVCAVELAVRGGDLLVLGCDPFPSLDAAALDGLVAAVEATAWGPPAGTRARHGWR
jgi:hypothetical protein